MLKALFDWISEFLATKLNDTFGENGPLANKYPGKTRLQRFYLEIRRFFAPIIGLVLLSIILLRLLIIYNHLVYRYHLRENIPDLYKVAVSTKLTILTIIAILLIPIYGFFYWKSNQGKLKINFGLLFSVTLIILTILSVAPFTKDKIYRFVESEAFYQAERFKNSEQYQKALEIFNPLVEFSQDFEVAYVASQEIAFITAQQKNYKDSISSQIQFLALYPDRLAEFDFNELHESIYNYGEQMGMQEAETLLQGLATEYPSLRQKPLYFGASVTSPVWLGISPSNLVFVDFGDVYHIGLKSMEEGAKLRALINKYPDDPLVGWARLILGEHNQIADVELDSRVRDWALYKSGLEAYQKRDFITSSMYYQKFVDEFSLYHAWSDDAGYRLARSYELLGKHEAALEVAMEASSMPDGNMGYIIAPYTIALIDYYFDSAQLEAFIAKQQTVDANQRLLSLLKFCLAEQLFKEEKYVEAIELFEEVRNRFPGSLAADLVKPNLTLLKNILAIQSKGHPENVIEMAQLLINKPADWGPEPLVFYNDLYLGARFQGLGNIGIYGPTWDYFLMTNDHLRAAKMLEQFVESSSTDEPLVPKALYLMDIAYYNLTYWASFLPSTVSGIVVIEILPEEREQKFKDGETIEKNLETVTNKLLTKYPNSPYTPEALTIAAIGFANLGKSEKAVEYMQKVVNLFPKHNLANNALIYNARTYFSLAENQFSEDQQCVYYRRAEALYGEVIARYPEGHVGQEAQIELEKLKGEIALISESCP